MSRIRVLLVTQSYHPIHGGIGEHVRHLALALGARGHEAVVLTAGPPPPGGEPPGPEVIRLGRRIQVPSNGSRATIAWRPSYRLAVRSVLRDPYDIVHVHSPLEPFLPWAVLREARAPCVGTFHNAGSVHWGYRFFADRLRGFVERLDARTAVSRCAARYVGRHFPGRYHILANGVDTARFRPGEGRRGRPRPALLFVGRLEKRKGIGLLLDGVSRAAAAMRPAPRLLVVGDGSLRGRMLRRAARLGVDLEWIGPVSPAEIPGIYRSADLLVAPALFGESFGIVLLEALASGLPVVASSIEGYQELLARCPAAELFRAGDAADLGRAIARALETAREERVRREARRFAIRYGWDRLVIGMEAIYRTAAGDALQLRVETGADDDLGLRVDSGHVVGDAYDLDVDDAPQAVRVRAGEAGDERRSGRIGQA